MEMTDTEKTKAQRCLNIPQKDDLNEGFTAGYDLTPEEDQKLLRKIDKCLLPVMAMSYFFQFLDKTALSSTAILGIRETLHLTGQEYSWSSGIYYFGYLAASYPAGALMVRWRVGKTVSSSVFIWGTILMLTAVCSNAGALLAARFFLGVAEAPIAPGLTILVSMWYKRSEQPMRHAAWFLGNTLAGIFGGLIQYGIGHITSIAPWKAIFLILGAVTIGWSICAFFLLPDTPENGWFLSELDRINAVVRVKENLTGIKNNEFKWNQSLEAFLDLKTWFLFFIQLATTIPNGGITSFNSIVIKGFGFGTFDTLLLSSVMYIVQLFLVLLGTGGSTYFQNTRTYWMSWNFAVALVGAVLVRELPEEKRWGRFAGTCLSGAFGASFPLVMSLMSGNFGGFTKKTTVSALVFIAYCTGNIIGPQLFFASETPTYESAFLAIIICLGAGFFLCLLFRYYLARVNRQRDLHADFSVADEVQPATMVNLMDRTDKEISQFRYVY